MPKREALQKLAQYIEEYTGRLTKQENSITAFTEVWKAFSVVKSAAGQNANPNKKEAAGYVSV